MQFSELRFTFTTEPVHESGPSMTLKHHSHLDFMVSAGSLQAEPLVMKIRSSEGHGPAGFLSCQVEVCSHLGSQPRKKQKPCWCMRLVRRQVVQLPQNKISNLNLSSEHFAVLNLKVKQRLYKQEGTEDSCSNMWTNEYVHGKCCIWGPDLQTSGNP